MDFSYDSNPSLAASVNDIMSILERVRETVAPGQLSQSQIQDLIKGLPTINERKLDELGHKDSLCPICYTSFLAILAEEETAEAMDSPAHPVEELGVTRLAQTWQCGHLFCRKDISKWIQDGHDSCPMCRRPMVEGGTSSTIPVPESEAAQLDNLLDSLLSGGTIPGIFNSESRREDDEDRREFSGMYS